MNYSLLLESILYYSPNFHEILLKIKEQRGSNSRYKENLPGYEIAEDILSIEGNNIIPDISFLDIDNQGVITFSSMNQALNKINKFGGDFQKIDKNWLPEEGDLIYKLDKRGIGPDIYHKNRNQIKLGKLIKKLFNNKYTDIQIEEFVNIFKAEINKIESIQVWEGQKVAKAYDSSEYKFRVGSLGNSCMNDKFDYLELYYINPEVCKVVVVLENDKIVARALLWKISSNSSKDLSDNKVKIEIPWFLDRVYSTEDYLVNKLTNWAKEKGYAHKKFNNSSEREEIIFNGQRVWSKLQVKVIPPKNETFPYMDTFSRLDIQNKIIHNDAESTLPGHILHSTMGSFSGKFYPKLRFIQRFKNWIG
jgi:hypothetical protein